MTAQPEAFDHEVDKAHQTLKMALEEEPIEPGRKETERWYDSPDSFAHALIDLTYKSGYASGRSHTVMAAAAYYGTQNMWDCYRTQSFVAELFEVNEQTISEHYDEMLEIMYPHL